MDVFAVQVVGTGGKGINYTSIWHFFRIKNSLCNRGNTRNNEKTDKICYNFSQENPKIKSI